MHKTYKLIALQCMLFLEGLIVTKLLLDFAQTQQFFDPPLTTILMIGSLILFSLYTYSFIIATWEHKFIYYLTPIFLSAGISILFVPISYIYALIIFLLALLISLYDVKYSTKISSHLIKFEPAFILRYSTKELLVIYAILAAISVLVNPLQPNEIHISKDIAQTIQKQVDAIIQGNPDYQALQSFGNTDINIANTVQQQIDKFLQPYKHLLMPLLALLIFGVMQFVNAIVRLVFLATVSPFFLIAKKTRFLNTEVTTVEKEILKL